MKNSDKPAYPLAERCLQDDDGLYVRSNGLTKREYFAAMAMQGLLSNPEYIRQLEQSAKVISSFDSNNMLVRESLDMADELLKQLES
jgi:hypothetical protein